MNNQKEVNDIIARLAYGIERIDSRKRNTIYINSNTQYSSDIGLLEDKVDLLVQTIIELEKLLNK